MRFGISEFCRDDVHVVEVDGDLELTSSPAVIRLLKQLFDRGAKQVVLDLTRVSFMDSTGIAAIIVGRAEAAMRNVRFLCVPGASLDLLTRVGLDRVLELADTQTAAIEALGEDPGTDRPAS